MGTDDYTGSENDNHRNEGSENPIEDSCQQIDSPPSEEVPADWKNAQAHFAKWNEERDAFEKKASEDFEEMFNTGHVPDFNEIENIVNETKKEASIIKNLDEKIAHYSLALKKIDLIIKKGKYIFDLMDENGDRDPNVEDSYLPKLDLAEISRNHIYCVIQKLENRRSHETDAPLEPSVGLDTNKVNEPPQGNALNNVKTSIQEQLPSDGFWDRKQAAQYCNVTVYTINLWVSKYDFPCNHNRFKKDEIDKWMEDYKQNKYKKDKKNKKTKKQCHFVFKERPIEILTDVLVHKSYLDRNNADLMKDRFSIKPQNTNTIIFWSGDLKSLMSFIYLSDRLGFIDKDKTIHSHFRVHDTSAGENKEKDTEKLGNKEVQYSNLINNFTIPKEYGISEAELSREWKEINDAIKALRLDIIRMKDPKIEEDDADIVENMTRKEAILLFYSDNNMQKTLKIDNKCDREIFELFHETMQMLKKKIIFVKINETFRLTPENTPKS